MMNYPYPPQAGTPGSLPATPGAFPMSPGTFPMSPGTFPTAPGAFPPPSNFVPGVGNQPPSTVPTTPGQLPIEESYIENILRLNLGKMATIYMTFENNTEWNAKVFRGRLEAAGRDHIIISDPATGMRYLLLMVNLDYITFDQPLNYYYPFSGGGSPFGMGGQPGGVPVSP